MNESRGKIRDGTHVLMLDVLEQFELTVSSFAENGGTERFHDLLYRNRSPCELVFGRARTSLIL